MVQRDVEADDRTVAPADDRRFRDMQKVHQPDHIGRHQIVAIGLVVAGAAAVAAAVHDDDAVARLERANLVAPVIGVGEPAMQQDHRLAIFSRWAERGVPDFDAVDRGVAALRRGRQSRGRRQGQPLRVGGARGCHAEHRH